MFAGQPPRLRASYRPGIKRIPLASFNLEVPTIAAANGPAVGAGCDRACMCDIRIAPEKPAFAEAFVTPDPIPGDGGAGCCRGRLGCRRPARRASLATRSTLPKP